MARDETIYTVRLLLKVDHPEQRNASFRPVPAGSHAIYVEEFRRRGAAFELRRAALAGEWDCGSEFAIRAEVEVRNPRTGIRRWARRPMHRFERNRPFMDGA